MIKLIASDMDGTLLDNQLRISAENIQAIRRAQREGILFLAASGRNESQIRPLLAEEGIKCPIIALNGAKLYDETGTELLSHELASKTVQGVLETLEQAEVHVEMTTSAGSLSNNKRKRLEAFAAYIQETNPSVGFEDALEIASREADELGIQFVSSYREVLKEPDVEVYKLSAYTEQDHNILLPVKESLLQRFPDLAISSFHRSNLEINHLSAQKGLVLSQFAAQRGITARHSMAIGDNQNDLSMLQWAYYSVAMMNGSPQVKSIARHITTTNDQHGVARAIEKFTRLSPDSSLTSGNKSLK